MKGAPGCCTNPSICVSFMFGGRIGANPETSAADRTPGRFIKRPSSRVQKSVIFALSVYVPLGSETRIEWNVHGQRKDYGLRSTRQRDAHRDDVLSMEAGMDLL